MTAKTKPQFPDLMQDAAYASARGKMTELQAELSASGARRDAVLTELNAAAARPASAMDGVMEKARRLLGRETTIPGAGIAALRAELGELDEHIAVLRAAVDIQRQAVEALREETSRRLVAELLPTHRAMVREIAKRIAALDEALAAEHGLRDNLFQQGIATGALRPMPMPGFGRLSDENSRCAAYLLESVQFGFLDVADLPANLQPAAQAKLRRDPPPAPTPRKENDGWLLSPA